jgi:hypothetical protein
MYPADAPQCADRTVCIKDDAVFMDAAVKGNTNVIFLASGDLRCTIFLEQCIIEGIASAGIILTQGAHGTGAVAPTEARGVL